MCFFFFFNDTATTEIYTLSLHDALPISTGGAPNTSGWSLRVISNKFPALQIEGDLGREGVGLYDRMNGVGAHEVIIESPDHKTTLASLSEKQLEDVFWAYRDRILDLRKDGDRKSTRLNSSHGYISYAV